MKSFPKYCLFITSLAAILIFSCERQDWYTEPGARLSFSLDTVYFDTIFTTIGSTTQQLRVYNPYDQPVIVSSIYIAGGDRSVFRINVDGYSSSMVRDVEIPANDSIYVFVEVTLDPNNQDSIMVIQDSIWFNTNGTTQDVDLVAWGQDVHLIRDDTLKSTTWINDKPYLIYSTCWIDSSEVLNIDPGVRIYLHKNAWMIVKGTLLTNGSREDPVIIQGDRLEYLYRDIPGQWGGIYFWPGSKANRLENTIIQNGMFGLWADTLFDRIEPTLSIQDCQIRNMSSVGIYGRGTTIEASNTVVGNCGQLALFCDIGGSYEFNHCTFANYWSAFSNRSTPAVALKNYYEDVNGVIQIRPIEKAYFGNCIIYGNKDFEFAVDEIQPGYLSWYLDHCLVKIDPKEYDLSDTEHFSNIINLKDPKFINPAENDYRLDTLSPAMDMGLPELALQYPLDIAGASRLDDAGPDIGAWERIEGDTISR